jgi:hypothetical protein
MGPCEYKEDIEQLKTDRTETKILLKEIRSDVQEMKADMKDIKNGFVERKVETAIDVRLGKLLWKLILAIVGSSGATAGVLKLIDFFKAGG